MLIVSRALLGISGATIAPSTLSLIRNIFHNKDQRTVAIGVFLSWKSSNKSAGPEGLEPSTNCFTGSHSVQAELRAQ